MQKNSNLTVCWKGILFHKVVIIFSLSRVSELVKISTMHWIKLIDLFRMSCLSINISLLEHIISRPFSVDYIKKFSWTWCQKPNAILRLMKTRRGSCRRGFSPPIWIASITLTTSMLSSPAPNSLLSFSPYLLWSRSNKVEGCSTNSSTEWSRDRNWPQIASMWG